MQTICSVSETRKIAPAGIAMIAADNRLFWVRDRGAAHLSRGLVSRSQYSIDWRRRTCRRRSSRETRLASCRSAA